MKILMTGNVGSKYSVKIRPVKPMHIPDFNELYVLANLHDAYIEYAEDAKSRQTANDAWATANSIKHHLDKLYKRWRRS